VDGRATFRRREDCPERVVAPNIDGFEVTTPLQYRHALHRIDDLAPAGDDMREARSNALIEPLALSRVKSGRGRGFDNRSQQICASNQSGIKRTECRLKVRGDDASRICVECMH